MLGNLQIEFLKFRIIKIWIYHAGLTHFELALALKCFDMPKHRFPYKCQKLKSAASKAGQIRQHLQHVAPRHLFQGPSGRYTH
jgi:hypothetical protein